MSEYCFWGGSRDPHELTPSLPDPLLRGCNIASPRTRERSSAYYDRHRASIGTAGEEAVFVRSESLEGKGQKK